MRRERAAVPADLGTQLAADRRVDRQDAGGDEAHQGVDQPVPAALDREGELPGLPPREDRLRLACNLEGDVGSGVGGAYDEDCTVLQLRRAPIVGRVELPDPRIQLGCEVGHERRLHHARGHHDVVGLEANVTRGDHVPVPVRE
jgi:hypothetical protein